MGREIDERVVQMKFEAGQFERGISTSTRSLEEYKKALNFDDSIKGFEKLDRSAKALKLDGLSAGVEAVRVKFDLLQITAFNVLNRISNKAIDTGERLVKSLSIDQISAGWIKFEEKTGSVQTIMAATAKQFTDTGAQMSYVNDQLDKLNWFTDETSYNFVDMVNNIGKFTSNNIDLKTSVTAMQGIANWAAISGANAGEASRAMYNMSQAMAAGSMKLQDWISIENANMGTAAFKEMAIQMGITAGTLVKKGDMIVSANKGLEVSVEKFRETLSDGWLSKDVMLQTLDQYGRATDKLNKYFTELNEQGLDILTSDLISGIDDYTSGAKNAEEVSKNWGTSLEKTKEILEDFNNEQDQFGLKALKAAQEAKTFSDAINSVKDAVSTGWMKSFEYIIGDYMEAKEFFTDLAEVMYDIFAGGATQRNQNLKLWKEWGGREMLIDSIWNALSLVLSILEPIKAAWVDIFGEATAERMFKWTERLQKFMETLAAMAENNMPRLQRVMRGVFAVLDIILTALFAFGRAFSNLLSYISPATSGLLDFGGSISDLIVSFDNFIKETKLFDKIFNAMLIPIKLVIDAIRFLTSTFRNILFVPSDFGVLENGFLNFESIVSGVIKRLGSIKDGFFGFINSIIQGMKNGTMSLENIQKVLKNIISGLINPFSDGGINAALDVVNTGLFAVLLTKFTKFIKGMNSLNISKVFSSISGAFEELGGMFGSFQAKMEAETLKTMASSILILSAALVILASIDPERLTGALAAAMGLFAELGVSLAAFQKIVSGNFSIKIIRVGALLSSLSVSVLILSFAVKKLASISYGQLISGLGAAIALIGTLSVSLKYLSSVTEKIKIGSVFLISLATSIVILTSAVSKLGTLDPASLLKGLVGVGILLAEISFFIDIIDKKSIKFGASIGLLSISAALIILSKVVAQLATISIRGIVSGIGAIGGMLGLLGIFSSYATKQKGLLALGASMLLFGSAIKSLSSSLILISSLSVRGIVTSLLGLGSAIGLIAIAVRTFPKDSIKTGLGMVIIATALNSLSNTLAKLPDTSSIAPGLLALGTAFVVLGIGVKILSKNGLKGAVSISALSGALLLFIPAIKGLESISMLQVATSIAALTASFVGLGLMSKIFKPIGPALLSLSKTISIFSISIIALGVGVSLLSAGLTTLGGAAVIGLGGLSVALLEIIKLIPVIIREIGVGIIEFAKVIRDGSPIIADAFISLVLSSLDALSETIPEIVDRMLVIFQKIITSLLDKIPNISESMSKLFTGDAAEGLKGFAIALSTILGSIVISMRILQKSKGISGGAIATLGVMIVAAGLIGLLLAKLGNISNPNKAIGLATAISEVMIALSASLRIMSSQSKGSGNLDLSYITKIALVAGGLGVILSIFSNISDPISVIPLATAISEFLLAMSVALRIMDGMKKEVSSSSIKTFMILSGISVAVGAVIALLSNAIKPEGAIQTVLGISTVLLALAGVVRILGGVSPGILITAETSLKMLERVVLAMGILTIALGALMQLDGFNKILSDGSEAMLLFGQAIGNFFGGIVGGFANGVFAQLPRLGTYLSNFMKNAQYFFASAKNIPDGLSGKIGELAIALISLGAAELVTAVSNFVSSIFGRGDNHLADTFRSFGNALAAFSEGLGEKFDSEKVSSAASAGKALAELENSLPRKDGKLQSWLGEKDLETFGERIKSFGEAIVDFSITVSGNVDAAAVEAAANAGSLLAGLENNIAPQGGKLQSWLGEKRIDDFGTRIVEFGTAISDFSNVVAGNINSEAVESAVNAGKLLATLEENIPPQDGMLQQFLGSKSIDDFGSRLTKFGLGLFWFSFYAAGINAEAIKSATDATAALVEMEKNVDQSGGWGELFTGKSDFSSFGKHLEDLGSALKSYNTSISAIMLEKIDAVTLSLTGIIDIAKSPTTYFDNLITLGNSIKEYAPSIGVWSSNASSADTDKMSAVTLEIEKLLKLSELTSASQWISDIIGHANAMIVQLTMALALNQASLMQAGKNVAYWLIRGVKIGMDEYSDQAVVAAVGLAKIIQTTVEDTLGIASPSTVMIEEGHWIVKGIAEGITSDMSAEEAAKKKADNIVAAFQAGFETLTSLANNRQLKYDVWSVSDGLNASEAEKQARELELKRGNLEDAAERAKAQSAAFEAAKQSFAEGSKQYIDAENNMLTAMKEMYEIRNEIDKLQGTLMASGGDSYTRNNAAYIDYINSNKEAYEMLGWDQNKLIEDAKRKTGFGMVDITPAGKIDTQAIVDSALSEQTVSIVQEKVKKRVGKTVSSGVVSGIEAGVAEATNAMSENGTSSGGKSASDAIETAFNGLARVGRQTSGEWLEMGDGAATNVAAGFVNGLSSKVSDVYKASYGMGDTSIGGINAGTESASPSKAAYRTGTYVGQGLINGMASMVKPSKEEGYSLGVNTMEGLKLGIDAKGQEAIAAAIAVANAVKAAMRGALGIRSPSRITRSFGNYLDDGLAIGLRDRISIVENAGEEVANATLRAMEHANSLISDVIESDDAFHPTITPVLNLDDLKNQKGLIGKTFGGHQLDLSATRLQVGSIADQTAYRQNGINVPGVSTNYNFVQNNYSPKALNQAEIYRQTKNEFSRLKGASQR